MKPAGTRGGGHERMGTSSGSAAIAGSPKTFMLRQREKRIDG